MTPNESVIFEDHKRKYEVLLIVSLILQAFKARP